MSISNKEGFMKNTLFPTGLIISEEYLTFEDMKEHEKNWDIQSIQLAEGLFHAELKGVHTPNLQLAFHHYSTAMQFYGTYPKGSVLLYVIESETPAIDHDRQTSAQELLVGCQNGGVDVLVNSSSTTYTLAVEEELFYKAFYNRFSILFEKYIDQYILMIELGRLAEFFDTTKAWVKYLSNSELKMTFEHRYDVVEDEILNLVFDFIVFEKKSLEREKFDIAKVKKALEESLDKSVTIEELSRELGVSERQLYNAFKSKYGITPKRFLINLRLNAAKEVLLTAKKGEVTIADVAFTYGFKHSSHFTSEYKKLFGRTPSSTLNRQK